MFNTQRLILGRKRRKMTARALAQAIGVSPVTISRLENGVNEPEDETVDALATALAFPKEFFFAADIDELPESAPSFRSLSSMSAKERDAALSSGVIAYLLHDWISERFNLPEQNIPDIREYATPDSAAHSVRVQWGLGVLPISSMVRLLESKGVCVFSLSEDTKNIDAFSCWRGDRPFVFLNTYKSAERSRFDAAHELGHLVMHRHGAPQDSRQAESEADRFASAFLMPSDDVTSRIRYVSNLDSLVEYKRRWGVSVAALNYRLHKLGIISDWQHRLLTVDLSSRGYRRQEPEGLSRETSALWPQIFTELWRDQITRGDIAQQIHVPQVEIDMILRHLPRVDTGKKVKDIGLRLVEN